MNPIPGFEFRASVVSLLSGAFLLAILAAFPTQSLSAATENGIPRVALVVGNARYSDAPLRNPSNDANAISDQLKEMGFAVDLKVDASRMEMLEAIKVFSSAVANKKAIGLFYFAGHAAQLSWRNYLIPVNARIEQLSDLMTEAVDLTFLLENLKRAGNPMNIVILDACRDNPFGKTFIVEQKGLSQIDAPPGTLLAYATSPGNTAADGSGTNGLFTENLLKEMRVKATKIEDVFKRVRLNVRITSGGRQVPWESTSLEKDFYFSPPESIVKRSAEEMEKLLEEEMTVWQQTKASREPKPFENYLSRYPNGSFTELAQLRLDKLLAEKLDASATTKIMVAALSSAGANPYTKGTSRSDGGFNVGDSYTYNLMGNLRKVDLGNHITETVTSVSESEVTFNNGIAITDSLGNDIKSPRTAYATPPQYYASEYYIGKKWNTRFGYLRGTGGGTDMVELEMKVTSREKVTVPAGTFDAFKVEGEGYTLGNPWRFVYWIAPEISRRPVLIEHTKRGTRLSGPGGTQFWEIDDRYELMSFKQSN